VAAAVRSLAALALVLGSIALDAPARHFDFVSYDDPIYIGANPHVREGLTPDSVHWALRTQRGGSWHPVTWLSHLLDVELYGPGGAGGHHGTSIVLHALTALALLAALSASTGHFWTAWLAAALFAVHPLRVESVAWVAERKDLLCGLFSALTLLAYALYSRRPGPIRYAGVVLPFALALGSKSMAVTLPVALWIFDFWPLRRWPVERSAARGALRLVVEKLPLLAMSAAIAWVTYSAQAAQASVSTFVPLLLRLANALVASVGYLGMLFWPEDLAVFYPHPAIVGGGASWPGLQAIGAAIALVALTACAFHQRARRPWLLAGWLFYLLTLLPVLGIVQVGAQAMADRYTYIPSWGIAIALAWSVRDLMGDSARRRGLAVAATGVALLVLAAAHRAQLSTWRNSETLYTRALAVTEHNYIAEANLGVLRELEGDRAAAEEFYRRALADRADHPQAHINLGRLLLMRGELEAARNHFSAALVRMPRQPDALVNLGVAQLRLGALAAAADSFGRALAVRPDDLGALRGRIEALRRLRAFDRALPHQRRLASLRPNDPIALFDLALNLRRGGKSDSARADALAQRARSLAGGRSERFEQLEAAYRSDASEGAVR